ncbi:energy-coupling factor transporter transmembrane protein EcfT [Candidatus Thorarchaeota archaeon]|nr:MAG: energy-coupling factor transporter transmembrane protein EcfT [Candidatus Thorarchaeota archaeon]
MAFEYVKKDTPIDRMNPLVKLLYMAFALLFVVQCTRIDTISILLTWILIASMWWIVGKVELRSLGFLLKLLSFLFVFLFLVQGLTYRFGDQTVVLKLFDFPYGGGSVNYGEITVGGIMYGLVIALRVVAVVMVIPIFTMTSPMSKISASLAKIRVPQKIIFMFITAMRFVPLVQESMNNIIEAQKIRGFDLESASMYQKLRRAYIPIITPLLLLMFRRAMDLEVAINARAFGAKKERTDVEDISFKARDYLGFLIIISSFLLCMYLLYFDPTLITWNILLMVVNVVATTIGSVSATIGLTDLILNMNSALLGIPVINVIGGFFNQNLLAGYGAIIAILLIAYILYRLIRRRMRKKKRVKK